MKDTVFFKRKDEKGNIEWYMTRVNAHKRYLHTIKPIEDLLKYLDN